MAVGVQRRAEAVLLGEAGNNEGESGRLHHVDSDRYRHHDQQADVSGAHRGVVERPHPDLRQALLLGRRRRKKTVEGENQAHQDDGHARSHRRIDAHAGEAVAAAAGMEVHRQVEQHPRSDRADADPEHPAVVEGGLSFACMAIDPP